MYVYRLWGGALAKWEGSFWVFDYPGQYSEAAANAYRARYAVCAEWNPLACLRKCRLRAGEALIYGTTQSAQCRDGTKYDAQGSLQVFFSKESLKPFVDCEKDTAWKGGQRCLAGRMDY